MGWRAFSANRGCRVRLALPGEMVTPVSIELSLTNPLVFLPAHG